MHQTAEHAGDVQRYVSRRVANREDASDLTQQTLMVAWVKRETFRGDNAGAWLLTIARHLIIDYYRSRARLRRHITTSIAALDSRGTFQIDPEALPVCEFHERLKAWRGRLIRLTIEEQVAVLLADVYEYRDKDSAALLRMSAASFKLLLHSARRRLRLVDQRAHAGCQHVQRPGSAEATDSEDVRENVSGAAGSPLDTAVHVLCHIRRQELSALRLRLLKGLDSRR
jgi:RNA polymerase sigma-70 factor (ECF subfamily)